MSPRAVIRGGVLTFTAVDPADEGEYTCKALNTHGEHTARVSLIVQSMFFCVLTSITRCGNISLLCAHCGDNCMVIFNGSSLKNRNISQKDILFLSQMKSLVHKP